MIPVAFYAPLKPPGHPTPSGDRAIARLLLRALHDAGFAAELASPLRSFDRGDPQRQQRIAALGARLAERLLRRYQRRPAALRPRLWLTYHLYHKAPDHLGPPIAAALGIPYVVIEASYAGKQQHGPWQLGLAASLKALEQAALAICLNPRDRAGLAAAAPHLPLAELAPFIDLAPFAAPVRSSRAALAARHGLDPKRRWLAAVAMMRLGDKLRSYQLLAAACARLPGDDWQLLLVGDGEAAGAVRQAFQGVPQARWLGQQPQPAIAALLAQSEILLWPAVNEAFGMALLEAQAAGCAVVAGNEGGVSSVVADGQSGVLTPPRDSAALACALAQLLDQPERLAQLRQGARQRVWQQHGLTAASDRLRALLQPLLAQ